ncbi:transglycosylase family protein [Streptomyces sp. Je 1-79]|uniref:LysM peptidoglycan-binding domain-containing protein n=1 Tax=Streptomyces sp. Je 1-79 TaxID=2943847 RepID=UPI0027E519DD|nr:transglycosylase family protein [Streptomyces sp. Je 1-79]
MTGSALALPLLGAGSASAADAATWDRVAECESGGLWSAHFGNGLYGGLQFTQESWERHGGLAYATSADLASRAQQIAVAERAFAAGDKQWATCAPIAGLTDDGAKPEVDPGPAVKPVEPTGPLPESNRTTGLPAGSETGVPETATPETSAPATQDPAATPETSLTPTTPTSPSGPATPGTGKHRGDAAPEETDNPGKNGDKGRHASPTDTPTSDVTPDADAAKPDVKDNAGSGDTSDNTAAQDISGAIGEYTVKPGDSLSVIAQQNELPGGWDALYDANRSTVGADPDLILPGQSLDLDLGLGLGEAAKQG